MKKCLLFTALIVFSLPLLAQKATKGYKLLDDKEFDKAREIFEDVLQEDPNDVAANFGMSRYYGVTRTGDRDNEKALEYLVKAETDWEKLDDKTKGKYEKAGLTSGDLTTRRDKILKAMFEEIRKDGSIPELEAYAARFPGTRYAEQALARRDEMAYEMAANIGTIESLTDFLKKYPNSYEAKAARQKRDIMATDKALKENTIEGFRFFLDNYPEAVSAPQIKQRLFAAEWEAAQKANTLEAYEAYMKKYPDSVFFERAKAQVNLLKGQ